MNFMLRHLSVKPLILLLLVVVGFGFGSCSGGDDTEKDKDSMEIDEDYYDFQMINMSKYGIKAYLKLPDETANIGASTKPEILNPESHLWQIDVGPNFTLHIEDMAFKKDCIKEEKRDLAQKKFFKVKYLIDEPDMILYERELIVAGSDGAASTVGIKHKSYHVYGQKVINGITYVLESREEGYEKMIIKLMAKSIKSFEPIKAK